MATGYQGYENPQAVAKRRALAEALLGNAARTPGSIGEGLMAQEVEKRKPGAVQEVAGVKMVDYGRAMEDA